MRGGALRRLQPNDYVRAVTAEALGKIGPEAKTAIPVLMALLKDKDRDVRCAAADALGRIGPEAKTGIPSLNDLLKDKDERVRRVAADALEKIKKEKE
jgi:HEAT repeat protein